MTESEAKKWVKDKSNQDMTLTLSKQQKQYLDKSGPMNASTLQTVFKKSVQDQQKTQKSAAKIRKQQQKSTK